MLHRRLALTSLLAMTMLLVASVPTQAGDLDPDRNKDQYCDGDLEAYNYIVNGDNSTIYNDLHETRSLLQPGDKVTVRFALSRDTDSCPLTFVAYDADSDFTMPSRTINNLETGDFGPFRGSLSIIVPDCFFRLDFVYGEAIQELDPRTGRTYYDQGRSIDAAQGGSDCIPLCPADGDAVALAGGDIKLTWTATENAGPTFIVRSEDGGPIELIAALDPNTTMLLDTDTTVGAVYTYIITSTANRDLLLGCPEIEITAVPVFGTPLVGIAATGLGLVAYAASRRRM